MTAMPRPSNAPLAGITVVEAMSPDAPLALRLSGAMAGRIAADFGARVVMLEQPGGNPLRDLPPFAPSGGSALFAFLGAGKHSAIDRPAIAERLVAKADIVLADAGRPDLPAAGPSRVLLSIMGDRETPAHSEFTIMALGGLLDIVGDPKRPPLRLGGHQLAYAGGLAAYAALASALLRRPTIETARVSLLEVAVWINWKSVASVACMDTVMSRLGRAAEWPILRCKDGHVVFVHQPGDWAELRRFCDDSRLDAERFATPSGRRQNSLELADIAEEAFRHLTRREIQERAMAARLPFGPVWEISDLRSDPQMLARTFLSEASGIPRLPVLWNGAPFPVGAAPALAAA